MEKDKKNKIPKRKYTQIVEKPLLKYGVFRKKNEIVNELPAVGSKVIIAEKIVYYKKVGTMDRNYVSVIPSKNPNHRDVWNQPFVYTVVSYTKGIEHPLDPQNKILLETILPSGYVKKIVLDVIHITTGSTILLEKDVTKN